MEQTVAWMRWRLWWLLISTTVTDDKQFLDTFVSNQYVHSADSSCGNCCNFVEFPRKLLTGQDMSYKDQSILYEPIKELDIMLNQVNAGVSVDIISGVNDPAVFLFYSHRSVAFFPRSAPYNTFRSCRNLHSFDVDNIRFLGTYGKKINDLHKYSEAKSKLDFVERALRWRHFAPTAPNTLNCYPFTDGDSFVIETCPHVINITTVCMLGNILMLQGQKVSWLG
ncbi:BnaA09g54770D [Brassica napus]|uniref:BnaA09g54770D protein n=1 Tax=Brassica napus TaxID=3708 RepID=A0A078JKF7_BRANA|nr:BnaA09g54770D [Brassica napus]